MVSAVKSDLYPTRVTGDVVPQFRQDPTVWCNDPGPLSYEQLAQYDREGYFIFDDLLSPEEVEFFRNEILRLGGESSVRDSERIILEAESEQVRSIFEVEKLSEPLSELLHSSRLTDVARQVLGSEVYLHQSRVNYKPGFGGAQFHWHSDFETWHAEDGMPRPRAFSVSIALTENMPFNGPLMVIPGSHKTFVPTFGETPDDFHKTSLQVASPGVGSPDREILTDTAERYGIRQIEGAAGSAVMFDCNLLHASNGNVSPFARSNIFVVYNSIENTLQEPFSAPKPRPQYLANREIAG